MKRYVTTVLALLVLVVGGYFVMWYGLAQVPAGRVAQVVRLTEAARDASAWPAAAAKVESWLAQRRKASPSDVLLRGMASAWNRNLATLTAATDPLAFRVARLALWGDLIDLALDRADYHQVGVPLGAMRKPLEVWTKEWEEVGAAWTGEKERHLDRYWNYRSVLRGRDRVLSESLKSSEMRLVLRALDEIERTAARRFRGEVLEVFKAAAEDAVKMKAARALMAMSADDAGLRAYVAEVLGRKDASLTSDFVAMVPNLRGEEFREAVAALTNHGDPGIRGAAHNAYLRMLHGGR